jgi:hypothetical protein
MRFLPRSIRHVRRLVAASLLLLACHPRAIAQSKPTQYEVKAAYLLNFAKFVKWPPIPSQEEAFQICLLGSDPYGAILPQTVSGERLEGKSIEVKRISTAKEAAGCRIVNVGSSEQSRLASVLPVLIEQHALVVSDLPNFCDRGGVIGFLMEGGRVRFEVNLAAAEAAGLNMSSDLLRVATTVKKNPSREGR